MSTTPTTTPGASADGPDPTAGLRRRSDGDDDRGEPLVSIRRARALGVLYLAAAALMAYAFGAGSPSGVSSRFGLNPRGATTKVPDLVVPTRPTVMVLALVCALLGGVQLARGFGRRTTLLLGLVAFLFVFAFLAWAARGSEFSMFGMLQSTLLRATPLALGAMAGLLCERSGIINIAIEGMMLAAAFTSALVASASSNLWVGLLAGAVIGAVFGAALATLSIRFQVDQVIGGTVVNIFALGMTSYLATRVLRDYPDLNNPGVLVDVRIPLLASIPFVGPLLFDTSIFVYLMFALVVALTLGLGRTRWGLRLRSVGEHPKAADTVGINVRRTRFRSVVLGGAIAGLAGTFLTLGSVGRFEQNMTAGRGFIALAALIFGRWKPTGALAAALLFGFAESLQSKLAILDTPIPSQFLLMAPYLLTLFVVAGVVGKSRPPAAEGQPY